ncbi:MAG TPA: molybdopterin cofactor-binding domain-containing protein [Candidatus Limnocylindria bacterium]|nr:molybdopterin cofactor-binding domain-containing protein [Candidatus Limnocylindria bacterium]
MSELSVVGRRLPKVNSWQHLTGAARYADDVVLPRMLYGRLLRSTHPHARIRAIDTSAALAHPGVVAVVTGRDMPEKMGIMPSTQDETALAVDRVRYVGEPVAGVAAVDEDTAFEALSLIRVDYEPLEPIFTIEEALERDDVRIHDESRRANVFKEVHLAFGDLDGGFASADHVREDWTFFEGNTHAPIETHSAVASYGGDDKLTLWTCTQVPHYLHRELEKVLGISRARIRVIATPNGGAFGGKSDPFAHEFAACLLSMRTRRPVKITLDREEVFYAHRGRHPVLMHLRTGVRRDGEITACHLQTWLDGGAYASYGIATTYYTGALLTVTYRMPAYKFDGVRVYTNKPPCGPKRGHGTTQPRFAFETQLDKIAHDLGLDPLEYRMRILQPPGSRTVNGLRITSMGLGQCLEAAGRATRFSERHGQLPRGKGIGVAGSAYISGAGLPIYWNDMPHSAATVKIDRGGGVTVYCGTSEIGQGSDHMLATVVAEVLGVLPEDVHVVSGDTALAPVDLGSYSSRVTFMAGNATKEAACRLREQLFAVASEKLEVPTDRLAAAFRRVYDARDPGKGMSFVEAANLAEARYGVLSAGGSYRPPKGIGGDYKGAGVGPTPAYSYQAAVAEVSVDVETGTVTVDRITTAHDCGRALNPVNVEGQIEGSAYMGYGEIIGEEQVFRAGLHKKPSLLDYKLPTSLDTPALEAIVIETVDAEGPFGGKEAGDGPLNPVIPAIANAVYDAIGVRFDETPITPDKVLAALGKRDKRGEPKERVGPDGLGSTGKRDPKAALRRLTFGTEAREKKRDATTGALVESAPGGPGPEPGTPPVGSR